MRRKRTIRQMSRKTDSGEKKPFWHVKKRTLLAVAGCVWLIAGFNVARLGVISYINLETVGFLHILLSIVVFCTFGLMF